MKEQHLKPLSGELLEEETELTLAELCRACQLSAEHLFELVEEGVVEPEGPEPRQWRFHGRSVLRVRSALSLERDLRVNTAGAALALDLLEELDTLRNRLRRLEE